MNPEQLLTFIQQNVPVFINARIVSHGIAYHYTDHYLSIVEYGGFLGHPINENIDNTQITIPSNPASDPNGVVFAYENLFDAQEEGAGSEIIEISFQSAIITTHSQEAALGAPDTVIILCGDIVNWHLVQKKG
jgi:hypothetical protein